MEIELLENQSLKEHHTFGIDVKAKYFIELKSIDELKSLLDNFDEIPKPHLILGSGSNLFFEKDFEGTIIKNSIKGINIIYENEQGAEIEVMGGEIWDDFVDYAVEKNLYGIENLKLIPGTVGAAPVQNIGAYGMEVSDTIKLVKAYGLDGKFVEVTNRRCRFAYRSSVFKTNFKNNVIISSVVFKLSKKGEIKSDYGSIREELQKENISEPKPADISRIVGKIRNAKLPDTDEIGNAGSFFKNPIISTKKFLELKERFPEIISYKISNSEVKIPAGWMIDKLGWKGRSFGGAAVHDKQALVIINKNNASSKDIIQLSEFIISDVMAIFGIELEREVNLV